MSSKKPVRLLILEASQNRAEELIVLLRKAGRATRAHQIESAEDLQNQLKEQKWDLLLGVSEANDLTMEQAIGIIRESERDIPIILIAEGRDPESITAGLRLGALDVALDDDDERLTMRKKSVRLIGETNYYSQAQPRRSAMCMKGCIFTRTAPTPRCLAMKILMISQGFRS